MGNVEIKKDFKTSEGSLITALIMHNIVYREVNENSEAFAEEIYGTKCLTGKNIPGYEHSYWANTHTKAEEQLDSIGC